MTGRYIWWNSEDAVPDRMAMSLDRDALAHNHVRFGWLMLAAFAVVGITLEAFHGFKTSWYLEEAYETRRLLFTLGHAHGALLSIVNVLFGVAIPAMGGAPPRLLWASRLLTLATVLLPSGFLLGGFGIHGSDPGMGVYLVPVGAVCAVAAFTAAGTAVKTRQEPGDTASPRKESEHQSPRRRESGRRRRQR